MRAPMPPRFGSNYVLPTTPGEKSVILACDQLGAILERDAKRGLDARPLVEHPRGYEAPVGTFTDGPVNLIAYLEIAQGLVPRVGRQDRRIPARAVGTCVGASPVRVDRPAEWHAWV